MEALDAVESASVLWGVRCTVLVDLYYSLQPFFLELAAYRYGAASNAIKYSPVNPPTLLWQECSRPFLQIPAIETKYALSMNFLLHNKSVNYLQTCLRVAQDLKRVERVFEDAYRHSFKAHEAMESKQEALQMSQALQQASSLCKQLAKFMELRTKLAHVYLELVNRKTSHVPQYADMSRTLNNIIQDLQSYVQHPYLINSIKLNLLSELQILQLLFSAELAMEQYNYMETIVTLASCRQVLNQWINNISPRRASAQQHNAAAATQVPSKWRSSFPTIISWFSGFSTALLHKSSLYFYNILKDQAIEAKENVHDHFKNFTVDYVGYIEGALSKLGAHSFSLALDASNLKKPIRDDSGKSIGYIALNPNEQLEPLEGIGSFPTIFCLPKGNSVDLLREDWANVVSLILWKREFLRKYDDEAFVHVEHYLNSSVPGYKGGPIKRCYMISQLNPIVFLVLIFKDPTKFPSDGLEFVNKITRRLRNLIIFDHLSPQKSPVS